MTPIDPRISILFYKYLNGDCTEEELADLFQYFGVEEHSEQFHDLIRNQLEQQDIPVDISLEQIDHIAVRADDVVLGRIQVRISKFSRYTWVAMFSAAILLLAMTILLIDHTKDPNADHIALLEDIQPGANRATLTFENGEAIQLSESQTTLTNSGDTIGYGNGGAIVVTDAVQWATLTTPRAGQYQIVLEDGTKVWLNAASNVRYPTRFTGSERRIFVSGEVYLEVKHDLERPFIVETGRQVIQVLGTKFNIEAYPDMDGEATTLVDGSVRVQSTKANQIHVLRPGQQAKMNASGTTSVIEVDTYDYTAWTEGLIVLNSVSLDQVVRQLERWYDVEFGNIPASLGGRKIFGSLKRDLPLKDVLQALEVNYQVQFVMNERRVDVKGK